MAETTDHKKLSRQVRFYSWTGAAVMVGILFALNFIASFLSIRLDTSQGQVYSLSKGTKQLLKSLDDTLLVQVIFSSKLPPPYNLNEQYIRDLLAECRKASHGKLRVEYVDPNKSEQDKQRAMREGIYPVELNVTSQDKIEVQACFMGLSFHYSGQRESIPFIQDTNGLEYELAQRIKRLESLEKPTIGFITNGNGLALSDESMGGIKPQIDELYSEKSVDLSSAIPSDLKALWIMGPTTQLPAEQLARLKDWLKGGGALGLLIDRRMVKIQEGFQSQPITTGFEDFLKEYGIDFPDGFIEDLQADRIQVQSVRGPVRMINLVEYPYFPMINDLDRTHPATKSIANLTLPFGSPLIVEKPVPGLVYSPLARTSRYSWLDSSPDDLSPFSKKPKVEGSKEGPFNVILLVQGNFNLEQKDNPKKGRLIVCGNSRFVRSDYGGRSDNPMLFLNLLDWSAQDEILLSIRTKGNPYRPLKRMPEPVRYAVKFILMFSMPVVAVFIGLFVWRREKIRRSFLRLKYQED